MREKDPRKMIRGIIILSSTMDETLLLNWINTIFLLW